MEIMMMSIFVLKKNEGDLEKNIDNSSEAMILDETDRREIEEQSPPVFHEQRLSIFDFINSLNVGPLARDYLYTFFSHGLDIDSSYGPYCTDNLLKLGNQNIFFDQNDNLIIDNEKIKNTPGLLELIFNN